MGDNSKNNNIIAVFGLILIIIGVVCNEWVLAAVAADDGVINSFLDRIIIRFLDVFLICAGTVILKIKDKYKLKDLAQKSVLLFVSLIFCLLVFEIILQIVMPTAIFHPDLPLWADRKMKIRVDLLGVPEVIYHSTNKWGMRGDKIPPQEDWDKRTTVVTIGGSTTHDYYLSDDKTWSAQLQTLLRQINPDIIVQNAGISGHSTRGHLLMMKTVIPEIKPDVVILLVGINDLGLSLNEELLLFGGPAGKDNVRYYLFTRSKTLQFFNTWWQVLVNKNRIIKETQFSYPNGYPIRQISGSTPLPDSLETMLPSLKEFKDNIAGIIDAAKREGVKIVFLTQPMLFDDTAYWDRIEGRSYWMGKQKYRISASTYWKMLKVFNDNLIKICKSEDVLCFDLASVVPHEQKYFYDDVHYNDAGAELTAKKVFNFMKNKNIIRRE